MRSHGRWRALVGSLGRRRERTRCRRMRRRLAYVAGSSTNTGISRSVLVW
jgi:hypothetical protein